MRKLEVRFRRAPADELRVGTLAEDRGRVFFEYAPGFLIKGWSLSPICLPFRVGLFEHTDRSFGPLPGVFDDSLPDGWGLLLMDRHFRSLHRTFEEVGPLDRLAFLGDRTMGALTYHPVGDRPPDTDEFDLCTLARHAGQVLSGDVRDVLPALLQAGGSPGGARPKVLVGWDEASGILVSGERDQRHGYEPWLIKFLAKEDPSDLGAVEYAYSRMAAAAGVDMPPTRLFETKDGRRYFGAKRFDRDGNRRFHLHTLGNLVHTNFRVPSADYADLLKVTSVLTKDQREVHRAFRRGVFNVMAHNRDDHVKNFAFLLDDKTGQWALSPAYDLLFTAGPGGEHTMTVNGEGRRPGRSHLLMLARQAGIPKRAAVSTIDEVSAAVSAWKRIASNSGVSSANSNRIAKVLREVGRH